MKVTVFVSNVYTDECELIRAMETRICEDGKPNFFVSYTLDDEVLAFKRSCLLWRLLASTFSQLTQVRHALASSPGCQLKFRKKDGLVPIATILVRMRWPLPRNRILSL